MYWKHGEKCSLRLRGQGDGWAPLSYIYVAAEWLGNQANSAEREANLSTDCGSNPQGCPTEKGRNEKSRTVISAVCQGMKYRKGRL